MKKEEILEKSRKSNKDEGMEHAENQGRKIGFIIFALLYAFISIYSLFFGEPNTFYAVSTLFWAFIASDSYGKYHFTKAKLYLITFIAETIASIFSLLLYIR